VDLHPPQNPTAKNLIFSPNSSAQKLRINALQKPYATMFKDDDFENSKSDYKKTECSH